MSNDIASNRSMLKEFLASIATISGDLSNITAPPFVLAENSTVEIPQYWADHPLLFVAPAVEEDPEKRALLVLKWFLGSLRNQQYAGRDEADGVKKPLNAFLGELFLGSWNSEELGETRLVSEQVSHHPPVTACYLYNDKHGIRAEGFTQQEITFSGSVSIRQKGYALLHIDKYDEDYLIPVPNVKVKGVLTGLPYPELHGEYSLISSNGYISHVKFEGRSFLGTGQKNAFAARLFHVDHPKEDIYTAKGAWNGASTITDARSGEEMETFDVKALQSTKLAVSDLSEQDPWETRNAWGDTIAALRRSDMRGTTDSKSRIENGQRQMRKDEEAQGQAWKSVFFQRVQGDPVFDELVVHDTGSFTIGHDGGIWKVDREAVKSARRPYHGDLLPTNERAEGSKEDLSTSTNGDASRGRSEIDAIAAAASDRAEETKRNTRDVSHEQQCRSTAEEHRAAGIASGSTKSNINIATHSSQSTTNPTTPTPTNEHISSPQPTDAQVEEYLRAKHSSANPH